MNELLKIVRYSNLFDLNILIDAIDSINDETKPAVNNSDDVSNSSGSNKNLFVRGKQYRGRLRLDENIATKSHHAQVTEGEMKHALLDGDATNYDLDRGFTRHPIDDIHNICVKLDGPSIVNHLKLLLWDKDARAYSYYVEVSADDITWTRIIDYRAYLCRSWQKLYFSPVVATLLLWDCDNRSYSYYIETSYDNITWSKAVDKQNTACRSWEILTFAPRIVVFIRICGTHNTANEVFHCVHFECPCRPDILKSYMNEQTSILTTDEHEENSVTYDEYCKSLEPLLEISTCNSSSTADNGSLVQTHISLPFMIKSDSAGIYPSEQENDENNK
ncbi:unnamed protein product [Rotaria socialis]|uniref:F5/8 type C domain-containing protein n=1 Tax=Rotaria socialis TaxID=392032 RepID=A0A820JGT6_9BILA|nr:unnamed protein product [Rotaria socialis]